METYQLLIAYTANFSIAGGIMRKFICVAIAVFIFASPVFSQEQEIDETNPCNGTWILKAQGSWVVTREEDGLTKTVPATAKILDCGGIPGTLKAHMNNVKAVVRCTNSSDQGGESYVQTIQITCE